jgi:hypothetical protein
LLIAWLVLLLRALAVRFNPRPAEPARLGGRRPRIRTDGAAAPVISGAWIMASIIQVLPLIGHTVYFPAIGFLEQR